MVDARRRSSAFIMETIKRDLEQPRVHLHAHGILADRRRPLVPNDDELLIFDVYVCVYVHGVAVRDVKLNNWSY